MLIQRAKLHSNIRQQNNVGTITKYVKSICIYIDKKQKMCLLTFSVKTDISGIYYNIYLYLS